MTNQVFILAQSLMTLPIAAQSQQQGVEATQEIMGQFCASIAPQKMWDSMQYYARKSQKKFSRRILQQGYSLKEQEPLKYNNCF